jgi:hypothetical protein
MFGQEGIPLPRTTFGAKASRQGVEICCTSFPRMVSYHKMSQHVEIVSEHSSIYFLTQCSDKGPSIQHLRLNIEPIYHLTLQSKKARAFCLTLRLFRRLFPPVFLFRGFWGIG